MRSQAQQQSNNTVPMSYFRKYILLLIYTFIHKINNHKKKSSDLTKYWGKKVTILLCTIALEFQVVSYMHSVQRGAQRGGGRGRLGKGYRQWRSSERGDVIRQTVCGKGKWQQKTHPQEDTCPWLLDKYVSYHGEIPCGAAGLCFYAFDIAGGLVR